MHSEFRFVCKLSLKARHPNRHANREQSDSIEIHDSKYFLWMQQQHNEEDINLFSCRCLTVHIPYFRPHAWTAENGHRAA